MYLDQYINFIGDEKEVKYLDFENDFKNIIKRDSFKKKDRDIRLTSIRGWEAWSVLNNLCNYKNPGIESNYNVLEYGAHPGFYCVYIQMKYGCKVWAIDNFQIKERSDHVQIFDINYWPDEWIGEINDYQLQDLNVDYGDITKTEFSDNFFDVVVSFGVHEHIKKDALAMKEIYRILKKGGLLSMTIDFHLFGWPYLETLQGRCYDIESLNELVSSTPFEIINKPNWKRIEPYRAVQNTVEKPTLFPLSLLLKKG